MKTEEEAQIRQEPFARETVERTEEFVSGKLRGKIAVYKPGKRRLPGKPAVTKAVLVGESLAFERPEAVDQEERPEETSYTIAAQIAYKNQLTIVSISSGQAVDEAWAIGLIRRIEALE